MKVTCPGCHSPMQTTNLLPVEEHAQRGSLILAAYRCTKRPECGTRIVLDGNGKRVTVARKAVADAAE